MYIVPKIIRSLRPANFRNKLTLFTSSNKFQPSQSFHCCDKLYVKMFLENENKHAYSIMEIKGYAVGLNIELPKKTLIDEEFEQIMKENWSTQQPQRLFEAFPLLGSYSTERKLCISNKMFDEFVDHLTDNMKHATDKELAGLCHALLQWPETESIRTRNYIEVWAALDDECLKRMKQWSHDEVLHFVSLFFKLNVSKYSDFTQKSINKLSSKAKQLSPGQLVQTMFFVGVLRKQPFDMHNLELQAIELFQELSLDDLAIMSMGFFKSKTPIRSMDFIGKIIDRIVENPKDIHEVSLAALVKVIRYSAKFVSDDRIYRLLDVLQHEVPRLSIMCTVHIALLGSATLTLHENCLTQIAKKMVVSLKDARLKDLERTVLTYSTFNYKPQLENCLFEKILDELRNPDRQDEIEKHPRCFACCVNFLCQLGVYPVDLMDKVLRPDFLGKTYGRQCYQYGREVLHIHNTSQIFCKEVNMHRLSDKIAIILAKKYTDYVPDENYTKQFNVSEKMLLEVVQILRENRGGDEYVVGDHILTHYPRGDIILCNSTDGTALPVTKQFNEANFGLLRWPPDNNHWIVLIIAGRNALIHSTDTPSGFYQNKVKELKALGYHAALVPWTVYNERKTKKEKSVYLSNLIKDALK